MADNSNIPEVDDTKTRVTSKVTTDTPGKSAPTIALSPEENPAAQAAAPAAETMTRRTLKLQSLASLGNAPAAQAAAPAAAPVQTPAAAAAKSADGDTRTRRTVKLTSLAVAPAVKPLNTAKPATSSAGPQTVVVAPADKNAASNTVTRRTQKLEALDTQDVVALDEKSLSQQAAPAAKISAVGAQPSPQEVNKPRQTVKVGGIAPAHTPVIDLSAKPGDTNTRKTMILEPPKAEAPTIDIDAANTKTQKAAKVTAVPAAAPTIDIDAAANTKTQKAAKVTAVPAAAPTIDIDAAAVAQEKLKAGNVDDTVKLQRPAPKPAMPGSVAPVTQGSAPSAGGIKLNKPKPAAPKPTAAPAAAPAAAAAEASAGSATQAEPTGNLGKNQTPPKEKKGLKVNTDALKDLGSAPMVQGEAPAAPNEDKPRRSSSNSEPTGLNVAFAVVGSLAALILIFIALVATTDYFNIWHPSDSGRVDVPVISEYVYENIDK